MLAGKESPLPTAALLWGSPLVGASPPPVHLRSCCRAHNYAYGARNYAYGVLFLYVRKVTVPQDQLWWLHGWCQGREARPVLHGMVVMVLRGAAIAWFRGSGDALSLSQCRLSPRLMLF